MPELATALAEFQGYSRQGSKKDADWGLEIDAYCVPEGKWKFKISKAKIDTYVFRPLKLKYVEFGETDAKAISGTHFEICRKYNGREYEIHRSASSHYDKLSDNPALEPLLAKAIGGVDAKSYYQWIGIMGHEYIHYERFQMFVKAAWPAFKEEVSAMQTPILDGDTPAAAKDRMKTDIENAIVRMQNAAINKQNERPVHYAPGEYYGASILKMEKIFGVLNDLRAVKNCPR